MAKVVIKSKVKKAKRKFPVEIRAPEILNSKVLGHANVSDLNSMIGRTVKMNLMYITGNVRNQNIRLKFSVNEASSGVANTIIKEYSQVPYFLRRFVKKGSDLIETSEVFKSKDGKQFRVKPFIVTKNKISALTSSALIKELRNLIEKELEEKTFEEFINLVLSGKIQLNLRNELKKIAPLKTLEFRKVELI